MLKNQYLEPKLLSKLDNLSLKARMVVEGFIVGLHKSPYHGFSVEFSEHRSYGLGDEIKHVDWKLYGKTDRFFIKQFEEETNLLAHLLLDQSKSMDYSSIEISKLEYSKILAASLAYLMLKQQDAVGITLFDSKIRDYLPPRSKSSHLNALFSKLEAISPGPETAIAPMLHKSAEVIKKRGLIILISDLFDNPEEIISGLKHFRYKGHEVLVIQVLDPQELILKFNERTKFRDMETGEEIITEPWHIQDDYRNNIKDFCNYFKSICRKNKIDYILANTEVPLDTVLTEYLVKRKKVG